MNCYVCGAELSGENETNEHIVINAIGGKLTSRTLICRGCNTEFGISIDSELARQLNIFSNLLDVKRRGEPQNIKGTCNHREIIRESKGAIRFAQPYVERGDGTVRIEANTIGQARKVLEGLKRNNPELDIDAALKGVEAKREQLPVINFGFRFGGREIERAVCKMAINFYMYNRGSSEIAQKFLPFIKGVADEAEVYYFYPKSEVLYKGEKDIMHSLILVADPALRKQYVYVELFNEFKMLVIIDHDYHGTMIYKSHHHNVVTNEIVEYDKPFMITAKDLKKYRSKSIDITVFQDRLNLLFQRVDKVLTSRTIESLTSSAMDDMRKIYPENKYPVFTKEMINFLSRRVVDKFVLTFQHRLFGPDSQD